MFNIDGFCPTIKPQIGLQTQFIINCHKIGFFLRNKGNRCSTGQRPRGLIKNLVFSLSHYSNVGVHNTSDRLIKSKQHRCKLELYQLEGKMIDTDLNV